MKFQSRINGLFDLSPSLVAEKQGLGSKSSIEDENLNQEN